MKRDLRIQREARDLHRVGRFQEAAIKYREAADLQSGFPQKVNLSCAADCDSRKPFNGTPVTT